MSAGIEVVGNRPRWVAVRRWIRYGFAPQFHITSASSRWRTAVSANESMFPARHFFPAVLRVLTLFVALLSASAFAAHPAKTLKPGQWVELPNTRMDRVAAPVDRKEPLYGTAGVSAVMDAWSGAVFDTRRNRLVVWGGGHKAYAGNELYAFDLDDLAWSRLTDPGSVAGYDTQKNTGVLGDGSPVSRHTYGNMVYLPPPFDALWSQGGANWVEGHGDRNTWMFEFGRHAWKQLADVPSSGFNNYAAFDPQTGLVYLHPRKEFYSYDPKTDRWKLEFRGRNFWEDRSVAIDPKRRKFVAIGTGEMIVLNIGGSVSETLVKPQGAAEIIGARSPGFAYHPPSGRLVAWSSGDAVYSLDLDKNTWYRHPAIDGSANPGAPATRGTYGRFAYSPEHDVFVLVNGVDRNVHLYRFDPDAGTVEKPKPKPTTGVTIERTGKHYELPSQAARDAVDGDVIEILTGTYPRDAAVWKQNDLTIRAVGGGRAHLQSFGVTEQGKAIWVIQGDRVTIEGIEFSGARVPDRNGAGIRHEGDGLTVRDCYFHDNENGILGGRSPENDVVIEHSEFARNGAGDGRTHNIYIGAARSLELRYSRVHHARVGHNVKSRAARTLIEDNLIYDAQDGTSSYAIDTPNGGDVTIRRNYVQQGPGSDNRNLISYGAEGIKYTHNRFTVADNILVNGQGPEGRLVRARGVEPALENNIEINTP